MKPSYKLVYLCIIFFAFNYFVWVFLDYVIFLVLSMFFAFGVLVGSILYKGCVDEEEVERRKMSSRNKKMSNKGVVIKNGRKQ